MTTSGWDAIILAGGRASRLGGVLKPHLSFEGMSLLERSLAAVGGARARVVVGDDRYIEPSDVTQVREFPRWSGPAAAISSGVSALPHDGAGIVMVLAADLPYVVAAVPLVVERLDPDAPWDGWTAVDEERRPQPLLAAYRREAIERRCAELQARGVLGGSSVRSLLAGLRLQPVVVPTQLCRDVDTPADARDFAISLPTSGERV